MIIPAQGLRIVLAVRPVDFRCGHDALAGLLQNTLRLDPLERRPLPGRPRRG